MRILWPYYIFFPEKEQENAMKRFLAMILALAMALSMAACGGEAAVETTEAPVVGNTVTYSVSVESAGGMALEGVDVYVYADSTLADMKQYGVTNEYGKVSFELPESGSYAVTLSGTPDGYQVEASYGFSGSKANITLTSALIDGDLSGAILGLGDVMYDFTVTTPAGETVTLSEILKEKGVKIYRTYVGEYATSMEMTGASISICKLDDEMKEWLDYPVKTPFICMK